MTPQLAKRLRLLASAVSVLVLIAILAVGWIFHRVRASLPLLDGHAQIAGLGASVTVDRDALGVPTIRAQSRLDVARALGFLHAQDRFFQMDVWRRAASGELAAVFGARALSHDRAMRLHDFRRIAGETLARLPAADQALLQAYADGVNAGLAALHDKPFEYLVVRAQPQPWQPIDTLLVGDAMLVDLQDDTGKYEQTLMAVRDQLGAAGVNFFAPLLTPADAALDGTTAPVAPIPGPDLINLRPKGTTRLPTAPVSQAGYAMLDGTGTAFLGFLDRDPLTTPGSNCFALSGEHTATGAAMLASDIHLNLSVPNTWYRASFEFTGHHITGITLPGVPLMIAGSNGRIAWSFTNAYVDTGDIVMVETNPVAPTLYRVPDREELLHFESHPQTIQVAGESPVTVDYTWTIWGPVVGEDEKGRRLVYHWTGHDPEATNLELRHLEDASDVSTAVAIAHRIGMPAQNILIADRSGEVAWTIAGKLPRRVGYDGRFPVSYQYGDRSWDGFVPPDEVPVVTSHRPGKPSESSAPEGRLWSSNQRMVGGAALGILGDGGYARPNRAAQVRDDLAKIEHATPRDLLAVQLDDRAVFLTPWNRLLLDTLKPEVIQANPVWGQLRGFAEKWEGRASVDAISYPIARLFRVEVYARVFPPIFRSSLEENPHLQWNNLLLEGAIWRILREKPMNLLPPQYHSWDDLLSAAVDGVIHDLDQAGVRLPYATWGERNAADIRHPFSYNVPWFLRSWLDMPHDPLPGDVDMPRVQTPTHGASERFVVSPGHEDEGIFEMPCGQSGHPLSPYYRAGHEAWVHGDPTPFLPGQTEHTLTLDPR